MMQATAGLAAQAVQNVQATPTPPTPPTPNTAAEIVAAAAVWRRLRPLKGHFSGGVWNADVDYWQGAKHQALQQLAQHLLARCASPRQVLHLLGPADTQWRPDKDGHRQLVERLFPGDAPKLQSAHRAQVWLYHWRGRHDQLALLLGAGVRDEAQQEISKKSRAALPATTQAQPCVLATAWLHDLE